MASTMASRQRDGRHCVYLVYSVRDTSPVSKRRETGIVRLALDYMKINGHPTEPIRLGPSTCGLPWNDNKRDCRTTHAYAQAVVGTDMFGDSTYVFTYERPCSAHDFARKGGKIEYGE